jgi:hypothetical protein
VLGDAIAALPPKFRRRLMVTADGAGASHGLITAWIAGRPPRAELTYPSAGLGARERAAIRLVRRRPGRSPSISAARCASAGRWRLPDRSAGMRGAGREAHVTELTGLLREGPHGDQLDGWPAACASSPP